MWIIHRGTLVLEKKMLLYGIIWLNLPFNNRHNCVPYSSQVEKIAEDWDMKGCVSVIRCVHACCGVHVRFFQSAPCYLCLSTEYLCLLLKLLLTVFVLLPGGYRTNPPRPSAWATWPGSSTSSSGAWVWPCWWPSLSSATSHATRPREWRWRPSPNPKPSPNTRITTIPSATAAPARQPAPTTAQSLVRARAKVRDPASTT